MYMNSDCLDKQWGPNCSKSCNCKDENEICNKTTGYCSSGCRDGHTDEGCDGGMSYEDVNKLH